MPMKNLKWIRFSCLDSPAKSFMRHTLLLCGLLVCPVALWSQASLPAFPQPYRVFKSDKQFNGMRFGPGNTIRFYQAPPDLQLDEFDFNADENLIYLEWDSGRLETRDIETGKRVAQIKPVKGSIWGVHDYRPKQLVIVTRHGVIRFIDSRSGKTLRKIRVKKGRFDYDIQQIILAPDGSWLAYVNQDNGKVLDLRTNPPKVLADLADGYAMALSSDGKSLWVVDGEKVYGFRVAGWHPISTAKLLDQVAPTETTTLAVLSDHGSSVAFIPSKSGLLRYELPSLKASKVSSIPTSWVAADREHNEVFVLESNALALYGESGSELCRWQYPQMTELKVSPSGRWLGDRLMDRKVELWSTQSLINNCAIISNHPDAPSKIALPENTSLH